MNLRSPKVWIAFFSLVAVSFLAGYASLSLLIGMLGRNRLWVFGVYCLIASVAATAVILTGG